MFWGSLWHGTRRWASASGRKRGRKAWRPTSCKLGVEALEDRVVPSGGDNLLQNGSFTSPALTSGLASFSAGDTVGAGWTVTSGTVEVVNANPWWPDADGDQQSLDLDGISAGAISQSFPTVPGLGYRLTFQYANNPYYEFGAQTNPQARVLVTGADTLVDATVSHSTSTHAGMDWQQFSVSFVATSTTTTVRFVSLDPPSSVGGITLDAVSAVALPAQEQVGLLINQVNALVSAGTLNDGEGNALSVKLSAAIDSFNGGNTTAGVNQLNAFVNQATALVRSKRLGESTGDALVGEANGIINLVA
jgi:choice-of-anchor C domain-containing protein